MLDSIDSFGPCADYYKGRTPYSKDFFVQLTRALSLGPEDKVLDLACGCGEIAFGLAPYVGHIAATDKSQAMIRLAEKKLPQNIKFLQHDLNLNPFASQSMFSLVTMGRAIPYLKSETLKQTLNSVLKADGSVATCGAGFGPQTAWLKSYQSVRRRFTGRTQRLDFRGVKKMNAIGFKFTGSINSTIEKSYSFDEILSHALSFPTQTKTILANLENFTDTLRKELVPFQQIDGKFSAVEDSWAIIFQKSSS